jgi:hypothetical protein
MSIRSHKPFPVALVVVGAVLGVVLLLCGGLGLVGYWIYSNVSAEMARLQPQQQQRTVVQGAAGQSPEAADHEAFRRARDAWHVRATTDAVALLAVAPQNGFPGAVPWPGLVRIAPPPRTDQPR